MTGVRARGESIDRRKTLYGAQEGSILLNIATGIADIDRNFRTLGFVFGIADPLLKKQQLFLIQQHMAHVGQQRFVLQEILRLPLDCAAGPDEFQQ